MTIFKNGVDITSFHGTHINPATSSYDTQMGIWIDTVQFSLNGKMEFCRVFGGIALPAATHLAWHNALK